MRSWQLQDAKARFSEFLNAALKEGPQIVTRRGIAAAVLIPVEEWYRLREAARPTLKELLLSSTARVDNLTSKRRKWKTRPPVELQ